MLDRGLQGAACLHQPFDWPIRCGGPSDTASDCRQVGEDSRNQSIEPGDGGWGAQLEVQGFSRVGRAFVFGSANYLLNPKDVNDAPSGRAAGLYQRDFNSVHDQYVGRVGVGVPVWRYFGA